MLTWRELPLLTCLLAGMATSAFGQAIVEYSLGASRLGLTGSKGLGKGTRQVLSSAANTLDNAGRASAGRPATRGARAQNPGSYPAGPTAPPPADVSLGLEREALIGKLGNPSMKIQRLEESQVVETFWYQAAGRDTLVVHLRDGKVTSLYSTTLN